MHLYDNNNYPCEEHVRNDGTSGYTHGVSALTEDTQSKCDALDGRSVSHRKSVTLMHKVAYFRRKNKESYSPIATDTDSWSADSQL